MPDTLTPSTGQEGNALAALRAFISAMWNMESVSGRDGDSGFDWNPTHVTQDLWGDDTVYFDDRTNTYWFDQNGNGTVETQFRFGPNGQIWYDINNDGHLDTIVDPSGFP